MSDNLTGNTDFPRAPSTLGTCGPACWGPAVRGQGQVTYRRPRGTARGPDANSLTPRVPWLSVQC